MKDIYGGDIDFSLTTLKGLSDIVQDESLLRKISEPVSKGEDIIPLVNAMVDVLKNSITGVALSAIQIGIPKRIFVLKDHNREKKGYSYYAYINPVVKDMYDYISFKDEGCLSFPGKKVTTKRYEYVQLQHQRIDGETCNCVMQGFWAVVTQHEMDHLDGKIMFDRQIKITGRNEPCTCGSNKKFKKCCGRLL